MIEQIKQITINVKFSCFSKKLILLRKNDNEKPKIPIIIKTIKK
jgi:hypothetical protein